MGNLEARNNLKPDNHLKNMKFKNLSPGIIIILFTLTLSLNAQLRPERQWPVFRGYMSSGVLDNANLPESFDFQKMINIRWKTKIPGLGLSSPCHLGDKLFITTSISKSDNQGIKTGIYGEGMPVADSSIHEWRVFCIDSIQEKLSGKERHIPGFQRSEDIQSQLMQMHLLLQMVNMLLPFFGSEGLYCYNYEGKLIWKKNFGILKSVAYDYVAAEWEFASSPVIYNGVLIIQCDVLENSFLAAYDLKTGKELWKTKKRRISGMVYSQYL